ncbi:hypothetical protein CALVIDRAFT_527794 [Calocera viscosa TUFC12733]|uniref:Uncharacterized protein n=1 Tax=Calocera viscosa (strain TUFC12733) TaxID=1330018 RepID=A0A167LU55_CALVF|nr:hypothetical protein CALVIDRAFT_527794 [Calocera viscosa TUFC12733]
MSSLLAALIDLPASPASSKSSGSLCDAVDAAGKLEKIWLRKYSSDSDSSDSDISQLDLHAAAKPSKSKGKGKIALEVVGGGSVPKDKVVVSAETAAVVQQVIAAVLAKKGAGAGLTAQELQAALLVQESGAEGPKHAAGDPDELHEDEPEPELGKKNENAAQPVAAAKEEPKKGKEEEEEDVHPLIARCLADKTPRIDLATATATQLAAEGIRWKQLGMTVGFVEEQARIEEHKARVAEGLRQCALEPEFEAGREVGAATYRAGQPALTPEQRLLEAKGMAAYRRAQAKAEEKTGAKEGAKKGGKWKKAGKWFKKNGPAIATTVLAVGMMSAKYALEFGAM